MPNFTQTSFKLFLLKNWGKYRRTMKQPFKTMSEINKLVVSAPKKTSIKRVAIWGYGVYGHCVETILSRYNADPYKLVAIFDRNYSEIGRAKATNLEVQDPTRIEAFYREGLFDEVLVAVFNDDQRKKNVTRLEYLGIPVFSLEEETPSRPADYFDAWEEPQPCREKEYVKYSFKGQYMELFKHNDFYFVFDKEGTLNEAFVRKHRWHDDYSPELYRPDFSKPARELKGEWCLLGGIFGMNYGHFTYDALDHFLVMERSGYDGKYLTHHASFTEELLELAGADISRFVWLNSLDYEVLYRFEKLTYPVIPDFSHKIAAPVLLDLAQIVKKNLPAASKVYPERLFVKRVGSRKLKIAPELLAQYGFHTIVPEELSVSEQIRYFEQAKIVLSPNGANTTNSLYMQKGSVLIETFSNSFIVPCFLETLALQDVYYLPLTQRLDPSMPRGADVYVDYEIDPDLFALTMRAAEKLVH